MARLKVTTSQRQVRSPLPSTRPPETPRPTQPPTRKLTSWISGLPMALISSRKMGPSRCAFSAHCSSIKTCAERGRGDGRDLSSGTGGTGAESVPFAVCAADPPPAQQSARRCRRPRSGCTCRPGTPPVRRVLGTHGQKGGGRRDGRAGREGAGEGVSGSPGARRWPLVPPPGCRHRWTRAAPAQWSA